MLHNIKIENILFIDIETVPQSNNYTDLDQKMKDLWERKAANLNRTDEQSSEDLYQRAGIYAEFGKVICICAGFMHKGQFRVKSFAGDEEKIVLENFAELLEKHYKSEKYLLCAHNGKEFDFPYLARRMIINSVQLPGILDLSGKKPWEVRHLDTMELWKFGDRKNYTSLDLLTAILDIPSPKQDIDGSDVGRVYWIEKDLEKIVEYCRRDVIAIAQLLLRFKGKDLIPLNQIVWI